MILITGATGFLGSYLAKSLINKGEKIRALKRSTSGLELLGDYASKIEWVEGDLLDVTSLEKAVEGIEKIYHCASIISSRLLRSEQVALINTNGSTNLLNMALEKGVKKVLHVSSVAAMGTSVNGKIIDENYFTPIAKNAPLYTKTKRHSELEAWRAYAEGLPIVIVNPSAILGAGYWHHEPMNMFDAVYGGLNIYTTGVNGFIDVRDTVELMIQLMESNISGERFILSAENISLKTILEMVADELKVKRPKYQLNNFLAELAWRYESARAMVTNSQPNFTKEDIRTAQIPFYYSNKKIIEATGYKFRSIAESLHDTAQSFLESKKKGTNYAVFE